MTELTLREDVENLSVKEHRNSLFTLLRHVLNVSQDKFDKEKASNPDRLKWGRLIVNAIDSYGVLLKCAELEDITLRLEKLELENQL